MIQEQSPSPTTILQNAPGPLPWISLLGLDGSGKSTVLAVLQEMLSPRPINVLHRRPGIVYRTSQSVNNGQSSGISHYSKLPHGQVKSILKLMVMMADWQIGYWRIIRPSCRQGALVISDRHALLDLIADPLRYRYGGPINLIFQMLRFTPMPRLIFLLDAPVAVLQARKQELSVEKAQELRTAYWRLMQMLPNGRIVNANQPVEQVALDIVAHLALLVEDYDA